MSVVCFDFDGTIAYSKSLWSKSVYKALIDTVETTDITLEDIKGCMSTGFTWHTPDEDFSNITGERWWAFMENHFYNSYIKLGISEENAKSSSLKVRELILQIDNYNLYDDAIDTLKDISRSGHKNIMISNNYPELTEVIEGLNISEYFDNIIVSANVGYDKPRKEIFDYAKALYPFENKFFMIGDNINSDIIGGKRANMTTILVHSGYDAIADYCAENLHDICMIIK